jgi:hypothetical protein
MLSEPLFWSVALALTLLSSYHLISTWRVWKRMENDPTTEDIEGACGQGG